MENNTVIYVKYFLDFDDFDDDAFYLITRGDHDVVFTGSLLEVFGSTDIWDVADDPWEVLDDYFEKELNIKSEEWVVG